MTNGQDPKASRATDLSRWVFWSTRETIDSDIPSVSAILETLIAVPLFATIAIAFETYLPWLISAAVAPMVLLRSDESVALGVKWFTAWEKRRTDNREYRSLNRSSDGCFGLLQHFWRSSRASHPMWQLGIFWREPRAGLHSWAGLRLAWVRQQSL